ncbi:uncharacterized protein [Diabrotica undecimpunctata]|uniref:uncharacterized protein isoform X2 n=1 Tax=Diabrotica undecimpunctata TaxID=50387 RepID=UPI003B63F3E1
MWAALWTNQTFKTVKEVLKSVGASGWTHALPKREASPPHYIRVSHSNILIPALYTSYITSKSVSFGFTFRPDMKYTWLMLASSLVLVLAELVPNTNAVSAYLEDDENYQPSEDDYGDNAIDRLFQKRACIRRGGNCDHRPNDCCYNSSCRCNLWGSNCRCQRMGLFQKWG